MAPKPLCIDLFCGLGKPQLLWSTYPLIQKLVARRAENQNHVRLGVFHLPPRSITLESRLVCQLKHARFSARLTRLREVWVFSANSYNYAGILEWPTGVINRLDAWISLMKSVSTVLCGSHGARFGTVTSVGIRRGNGEVSSANPAIPTSPHSIGLFAPAQPASAGLTPKRAVQFIDSLGWKLSTAYGAE